MKDDHLNQEINEGQRGRPIVSSHPASHRRSASGWRKSNVNNKRRSHSLAPRLDVVVTLSTADTAPTVPDAATHPPPSTSITYSERSHLEQTATVARYLVTQDPLPPDELVNEGPYTTKRTTPENDEHRGQAIQGLPGPINQAACPPSRGTPPQKPKADILRLLKKLLAALRKRKFSTPPRQSERPPIAPVHLPLPLLGQCTAERELYDDRASCYLTALSSPASWSRSEIAEDESFLTAMSREPEDLTEPLSEIDSSSLVPLKSASLPPPRLSLYSARSVSYFSLPDIDDEEPTQSGTYAPQTSLSTPTMLPDGDSLSDSPEGHLRQRPQVNTLLHCMPDGETGGESPSTDSSGSVPTSPQSIVQSNVSVSVAMSSTVASDHPAISREDIEETGYFDLGISKKDTHESLHMEHESQIVEVEVVERVINGDTAPEGTSPSADVTSGTSHFQAEITQKFVHLETQEGRVMQTIDGPDTGPDGADVPTTVDVAKGQAIQRTELQTTEHTYTRCVLDGQPQTSISGMSTQKAVSNVAEERNTYLVSEVQKTGHAEEIASPPADAGGEPILPTRSSDKQPSDTTSESRVHVQESTTHSLVQKESRMVETTSLLETESAANVPEPGVDFTAELLQQFFQMVEKRLAVPGSDEKAKQNDGAKPVSIVFNVTNNHIHNVSHGTTGDNYYAAIGHSVVGGQEGRNDIRNFQPSEITHTTQSYESQTNRPTSNRER
ncbi:hypothetical protein AB1N83_013101 [Pleurotus pulmonarius]